MKRLQYLRDLVAYLQDELRSIDETAGEDRALDADETKRFNDGVWLRNAAIAEGIELERRQAEVDLAVERSGEPGTGVGRSPGDDRGAPNVHRDINPFDEAVRREIGDREAAHRALDKAATARHLDGDEKTAVEKRINDRAPWMSGMPRHVLAFGSETYERAWSKAMVGATHLLDDEERQALAFANAEARAMGLTNNVGGYLIPTFLDPTVIWTMAGTTNPFRQISSVTSITGDNWNGVTSGGITMSWDTEFAVVSDDTPTFGQPTIAPHKLQGFVPISFEGYEDVQGAGAEIAAEFRQAEDDAEAAAFATGSGSGQPTGIVTALAGALASATRQTECATNSALAAADLFKARRHLGNRYRGRAVWVMNQFYNDTIRQLGTGGSLYAETVNLEAGQAARLLDKGVYEASAMSAVLNTSTNNAIVYGDFSNYKIVDRIGSVTEFIPNLFDPDTGRPTGQRGWLTHKRVGADSVNDSGFVLLVNQAAY